MLLDPAVNSRLGMQGNPFPYRESYLPGQTVSTEPARIQLQPQVVMAPSGKVSRWDPLVSGGVPCSSACGVCAVGVFNFPPDCPGFPSPICEEWLLRNSPSFSR